MTDFAQPAARARAYLGRGLAFPFAVTPQGRLATAREEAKVEQSIWLILSTALGERVMRPSYGCVIHDLLFEPNDPGNVTRIIKGVRDALTAQEPRIVVLDVTAELADGQPNLILIRVDYRIHAHNTIANLVYPFFITEGL